MSQVHVFAGNALDRAANVRRDDAWLAAKRTDPDTRFLAFWRLHALLAKAEPPRLAWLDFDRAGAPAPEVPTVFLGLERGDARFAIDVSALDPPEPFAAAAHAQFVEVRAAAQLVTVPESGILAQARALLDWHRRHRYCAACGQPTVIAEGGYMRVCTNAACNAQHFPRTDPVVITVVVRGDRCLLGRSARFPTQTYSALAGFMEPGESIEEAVRREVLEESGIRVGAVRYHSSQPWPFPASLMIGCFGEALSEAIAIDPVEIQDARWYSRDQVARALAGEDPETGLKLPQPLAIAHQLIRWWVAHPGEKIF